MSIKLNPGMMIIAGLLIYSALYLDDDHPFLAAFDGGFGFVMLWFSIQRDDPPPPRRLYHPIPVPSE